MMAWLYAIALSLTPAWYAPGRNPETEIQYRDRVETIAEAIAAEVSDPELAAAVLVKWHAESGGFRLSVHSGERLGDNGHAICLGQLHQSRDLLKEDWLRLAGTDLESTRRCAAATAKLLGKARRLCRDWGRAFSAYATGRGCQLVALGRERSKRLSQLLQVRATEFYRLVKASAALGPVGVAPAGVAPAGPALAQGSL
ncbi:MAG TPA: hypothetical protein VL137_07010 [Polyangiaceae bacterium]|nr:hypothetical protein [Polyangiaceae bacterium]